MYNPRLVDGLIYAVPVSLLMWGALLYPALT